MKNPILKLIILEKYRFQNDFAQELNIHEVRLSGIIHGRLAATSKEQKKIAKKLGAPVEELFPSKQ
jgi:plasmid maintenance system antidote protein VapI